MDEIIIVQFHSKNGDSLTTLEIFGSGESSKLKENGRYDYKLNDSKYVLKKKSGVIRQSRITSSQGTIEPGNYVGLLKLELLDKESEATVAIKHIEVCSEKLDYESEYRWMLEDIADRCADFLLQLESPVEQTFAPDDETNEATLAQRLYFLKGLLGSEEFQLAIQRIVANPNTRWRSEHRSIDVRQSRRLGRHEVRQFASASRRLKLPSNHALSSVMESIPERITVHDKRDTADTPENRFVKHALNQFLQTLEGFVDRLNAKSADKYPNLKSEICELIEELEETLAHDLFKQVSLPTLLPLNSPVLQRKEGYRQVLRAWTLFELAAKLSWSGGDDVYAAGKRDAAALYEYWVFFKLLDLVANQFKLDDPPVHDLINSKDLVLKLKAGKHLPIKGTYHGAGRALKIQFSYNRTFGIAKDYPAPGSWSRQMRPDYTLSLWPANFRQDEAETQELITHVHFDAKYKVDNLSKLFGQADIPHDKEGQELDTEKTEQRAGNYKRADLLKMHAYRDAIRRSAGAYILYPGSEEKNFTGFHELLPGLGAFPLRPNKTNDGSQALSSFLKEIVEHVCNRASQHEQQTYHTYRIHKENPSHTIHAPLPETQYDARTKPATETYVIHGWVKNPQHFTWIKVNGLYNFRTDNKRGSLRLHHSVSGASYLLLHGEGQYNGGGELFRIKSAGPRVFSDQALHKIGYGPCSQPYYLMFDIEPLKENAPLAKCEWNLKKITDNDNGKNSQQPLIKEGRNSALPTQGIPLSQFMQAASPK